MQPLKPKLKTTITARKDISKPQVQIVEKEVNKDGQEQVNVQVKLDLENKLKETEEEIDAR